MTDDELMRRFEAQALSQEEWRHRTRPGGRPDGQAILERLGGSSKRAAPQCDAIVRGAHLSPTPVVLACWVQIRELETASSTGGLERS